MKLINKVVEFLTGISSPSPSPSPSPSSSEGIQIYSSLKDKIDFESTSLRSNIYLFLGYMFFFLITIVGVADSDFYFQSRKISMPIAGIEVKTVHFFFVGAFLIVVMQARVLTHFSLLRSYFYQFYDNYKDKLDEIGFSAPLYYIYIRYRSCLTSYDRKTTYEAEILLYVGFVLFLLPPLLIFVAIYKSFSSSSLILSLSLIFLLSSSVCYSYFEVRSTHKFPIWFDPISYTLSGVFFIFVLIFVYGLPDALFFSLLFLLPLISHFSNLKKSNVLDKFIIFIFVLLVGVCATYLYGVGLGFYKGLDFKFGVEHHSLGIAWGYIDSFFGDILSDSFCGDMSVHWPRFLGVTLMMLVIVSYFLIRLFWGRKFFKRYFSVLLVFISLSSIFVDVSKGGADNFFRYEVPMSLFSFLVNRFGFSNKSYDCVFEAYYEKLSVFDYKFPPNFSRVFIEKDQIPGSSLKFDHLDDFLHDLNERLCSTKASFVYSKFIRNEADIDEKNESKCGKFLNHTVAKYFDPQSMDFDQEFLMTINEEEYRQYWTLKRREYYNQFPHSNLKFTELNGFTIYEGRIINANLYTSRLFDSVLVDLNFEGVQLTKALIPYSKFTNVNFSLAIGNRARFLGSNMKAVDFKFSTLTDADFRFSLLEDVDFRYSNLVKSQFNGAVIIRGDFRHVEWAGSDTETFNCSIVVEKDGLSEYKDKNSEPLFSKENTNLVNELEVSYQNILDNFYPKHELLNGSNLCGYQLRLLKTDSFSSGGENTQNHDGLCNNAIANAERKLNSRWDLKWASGRTCKVELNKL